MKTATDYIMQNWNLIVIAVLSFMFVFTFIISFILIHRRNRTIRELEDARECMDVTLNDSRNECKRYQAELDTRDTYHAGQIKRLEAELRKVKDDHRVRAMRMAMRIQGDPIPRAEQIYRFLVGK